MRAKQKQCIWTEHWTEAGMDITCLVGWCLTALSAQKGYIVPCQSKSLLKILISDKK